MKKNVFKNLFIILLIFCILFISNLILPDVKNNILFSNTQMIKNGDFEDGLKYWNIWKYKNECNVQIDKSIKKYGKNSIKIYNLQGKSAKGTLSQTIDASNLVGKVLRLNQWIKSDKLLGTVSLKVKFIDAKNKAVGETDIKTIDVKGTMNWNQQLYSIQVPNDPKIKKISLEYAYENCKGTLWIDNIYGEIVKKISTTNLIKNGGLEEGLSYWKIWRDKGDFNVETDRNIKKSGVKSIKIYNNSKKNSRGTFSQSINASQLIGKVLKINQWMKSDKLNGTVKLIATFNDASGKIVGSTDIKTLDINGTKDWNQQLYSIQVPNDSKIKSINLQYDYNNCTGTLWIDSIAGQKSEKNISSNLIKNGDFEEGISYWNEWKDKNPFNINTDTSIKKSGVKSLKIYNVKKTPARGVISQTINIPSNVTSKTLSVGQWVKTDKLTGKGIKVKVNFINNKNQVIEEEDNKVLDISPTQDWKQLKYNIVLPESIQIKAVNLQYIYDNCIGTIWFDGIDIQKSTVSQNKNLLQNASFEATINNPADIWSISKNSGNHTISIDKKVKRQGNNSLKLVSSKNDTTSSITQPVNLPNNFIGKTINISQWIKSSNFKAQTFTVNIRYFDNKGSELLQYRNSHYFDIAANSDWKELKYSLDIPTDKSIKSLSIDDGIKEWSGSIWIDDMKIEPYTKINDITTNPSLVSLKVGQSKKVILNINPSSASHKDLRILSLDKKIASIDNTNVIKAIKNGVTKIEINQDYQGVKNYIPVIVGKSNNITVNETNKLTTEKNKVLSGKIQAKSTKNSKLQYNTFIDGKNGYVNINSDGSFSYYPNKDFYGNDSFTAIIKDSSGGIALSQYNISVKQSSTLPVIDNFVLTMNQGDKYASGKLELNYQSLSGVKLLVSKKAKNGTFTIQADGSYKYIPKSNFTGYDVVDIKESNNTGTSNIIHGTIYVAPNVQNIKQSLNNQHPRIIANKSDFDRIKLLIKTDSDAINWFNTLKKQTDIILKQPVVKYQRPDGLRLVTTSTDYIEQLSFMYRITGDKKYADRAWKELQNICVNYPNWNDKGQFLDTAAIASGAAIGYDWLYDYLNVNQRKIVENAISKKALNISLPYYVNNNSFFTDDAKNWNIVCNSGMILAALSVYDKANNSDKIIQYGLRSIQNSLTNYYTDGGGLEGASYWTFATEYLMNLQSSLDTSLHYKNYFNSVLNLEQMDNYQKYIIGNEGDFNYSDSSGKWISSYFNLWFAKQLNRGDLTEYCKLYRTKFSDISIYDLIWYDPNLYKTTHSNNTNLDKYFESTQLVTMRSMFNNDFSTFLGFKGGLAGQVHGDLDIGTFVYEALGVRWAIDLGAENYGVKGYFDNIVNGNRWNYYRKRAEGHNTLVIGSSKHEDQVVGSESKIIKSNLNAKEPYSVLDMTPAYQDKALNVQREVRLLNNRKDLLITDSFVLKREQDVTWQMHTQADTAIVDGGKGVILTQDNKKVYLKLLSTGNIKFQVVKAEPSSTSPNPSGQTKNSGVNKIIVKTKSKIGSIKVQMTPLENQSSYMKNGGFEDNLTGWSFWEGNKNLSIVTDNKVKKVGMNSVKISNITTLPISGLINEKIDARYFIGKAIKVKQWVKSDKLSGKLLLTAKFMDENGVYVGNTDTKTIDISGTMDWNQQEYSINVPNNSTIKYVILGYYYNNSKGTVWIDEITEEIAPQITTANIIKNGNFEEGQSYWNEWKYKGDFNVNIDKSILKDGNKSVKIYNLTNVPSTGLISQILDASQLKGKALKITQWVKSDNLTGIIRLRAIFRDANGKIIRDMDVKNIDVKGTMDWNQQTYTVNVPNDSKIKNIELQYLYDNSTGSLWINGIVGLKINQITTNNFVKNGDFEEGLSYWNIWKDKGSFNVETDKIMKKGGVKSIKIYNSSTTLARGVFNQTVDSTQLVGKTLKITQWMKSDKLSGNVKLIVNFMDLNGKSIGSKDIKNIDIKGTTDWNEKEYTLKVPNDLRIKKINIQYVYDNCTGSLWLDNIAGLK